MPFDYEEYEAKCSQMTVEQLHKEWENYTRQISGGATGTAISSVAAPFTGGISMIGVGLSAPRIHNARKKREIIERFLQAQGTTHKTRKRDILAPMAISGVLGTVTLGIATPGAHMVMEAGAAHGIELLVASEVGTKVATHAVLEAGGQAVEHAHTKHDKKKGAEKLAKQQAQIMAMEIDPDGKQQYEASIYSNQSLDEKRRYGHTPSKYSESQDLLSPQGYLLEKRYEPQAIPPPYSLYATPQPPRSRPSSAEPPPSPGASSIAPSYAAPSYHSRPPTPESSGLKMSRLPTRPSATPLQPPTEFDDESKNQFLPPSAMPGALPHSYSAPIFAPAAPPHIYEARPKRYEPSRVEALTQSYTALSIENPLPASESRTPSSATSNSTLSPYSFEGAPQSYTATPNPHQSSERHPRLPPRPVSQEIDYHTPIKQRPSQLQSPPTPEAQLTVRPPLSPQTLQNQQAPQNYTSFPPPPPPQQPAYFPPPPNSPPPTYATYQPYNPQDYAHSSVPQESPMQQGYGERIGGLPYNQPSNPNVQQYRR